MKQTRVFFAIGVLWCVMVCMIGEGCSTKPGTPPFVDLPKGIPESKVNSGVIVFGPSIDTGDRTTRLPGNCDLLTVVQRIRELGGFRHGGIQKLTVVTIANRKSLRVSVLLTRLVKRAESVRDWGNATHSSYS